MADNECRRKRVLISSDGSVDLAQAIVEVLKSTVNTKIEIRTIMSRESWSTDPFSQYKLFAEDECSKESKDNTFIYDTRNSPTQSFHKQAYELCQWTDFLVLAPINADNLGKILYGMCDNLLLAILRGWDVSKNILMIPGMTTIMWENPMTKSQLDNIRKNWSWVHLTPPLLWYYETGSTDKRFLDYKNFGRLIDTISNQAGILSTRSQDRSVIARSSSVSRINTTSRVQLPDEIWTLIFERLGDWEICQALNIYTSLPTPLKWQWKTVKPEDKLRIYMRSLEWTILTQSCQKIITKLKEAPENMMFLSNLCVKLVIKFCLVDLLSYMESNCKDIFWASFGQKLLPTMASAEFGQTKILDWWHTSSSFVSKDYTPEAMDGASRMGFIHVLEWWKRSGLPLKYTEVAMEQASARGHISVLEWWKQASVDKLCYPLEHEIHYCNSNDNDGDLSQSSLESQCSLLILPGKSLLTAAQNNQSQVLRWWEQSGIPVGHSESVARVASQYGNIEVLEVWLELKGEKMSFDSTVLIDPTKNGHLHILQWWKNLSRGVGGRSGRSIQYKTCDIEEALEDSIRSETITLKVKEWWIQNGLNLGLQVQEWTQIKSL